MSGNSSESKENPLILEKVIPFCPKCASSSHISYRGLSSDEFLIYFCQTRSCRYMFKVALVDINGFELNWDLK